MRLILFAFLVLNAVLEVRGSVGDLSGLFQECASNCIQQYGCPQRSVSFGWILKDCFDCRYECMWKTVSAFEQSGRSVPQFFGKWPFAAISMSFGPLSLIIQEPASTLFSILNLFGCVWLRRELRNKLSAQSRMYSLWMGYSMVGIGVWLCSAAFHSRDFWLTEYLDYFAAAALIFYAFFVSLHFAFPLLQQRRFFFITSLIILGWYSRHIHYLFTRHSFDYAHNMFCCISLSVATALIYLSWAFWEWYHRRWRPAIWTLILTIGIGLGAAIFEIFDFPPILWIIDAHSLFHLATVPTPFLLGKFALAEAEREQLSGSWKVQIGKSV